MLLRLCRNLSSHILKTLHELSVSNIFLGYPFNLAEVKEAKSPLP
ncbi:MAG: hypothetical protein ACP5LW_02335 [Nitrososphaeria archaeon]